MKRQQETAPLAAVSEKTRVMLYKPCWREGRIKGQGNTAGADFRRLVVFCEPQGLQAEDIAGMIEGTNCLILQSREKEIEKRYQEYALELLREIQSIMGKKDESRVLIQVMISSQGEQRLFGGLSGLLKTAQAESSRLWVQLIMTDDWEKKGVIEMLRENGLSPQDAQVRYRDGKRQVTGWEEVTGAELAESIPWQDKGVYLITGGAGGLGLLFASEIARRVKNPVIVLAGRSSLDKVEKRLAKKFAGLGARIVYRQGDVSQKRETVDLVTGIREEFGSLNGIIHAAGVTRDSLIINKTADQLREVFAAKVEGLLNLETACRGMELDFLVLFSSVAASLGNPGQADYAAANAFLDCYAEYRREPETDEQKQFARIISYNWPLWQEGGMHVSPEAERSMRQKGFVPLGTVGGIKSFYQGWAYGGSLFMVLEGDGLRLKEVMSARAYPRLSDRKGPVSVKPERLLQETLGRLKELFGEITGLSREQIDAQEILESYGIDSVMISKLNSRLESVFREVSKTLFFEGRTLEAVARRLCEDYPEECMAWAHLQGGEEEPGDKELFGDDALEWGEDEEFPVLRPLKAPQMRAEGFEPIAVIGLSGKYPQAENLTEYWENLQAGKDCITEIPSERWSLEGFYLPDQQKAAATGKSYCKWGGFIDGFADFDPLFFNISPREALNMDPQERLFIEHCWQVLEDAGYTRQQLMEEYGGRVGVFAGITKTGFALYGPALWRQGEQAFPRTSFSSLANRVSYLFDLRGPSMPVDTMCSSSSTAIHEACRCLQRGECEIAIAGGVNLYLHPANYNELCVQQMLSPDGRSRAFGAGANGFVPGEGVGCVLLKSLSQAVEDGDNIYAVIKGTAVNHGGKTNGYTVPNPQAQSEVIRAALDNAGVKAREVSYLEAHGTGTRLGDPIEITGAKQAFESDTQERGYCSLGSVKSNIGHLEAAAGIAGLTKIVLQMRYKKLVPSLHAKVLNPNINFAKTPFVVQQEATDWNSKEYPRIAGLSSFGAGGANAHIVLEEYLPAARKHSVPAIDDERPAVIVLSARNKEDLKKRAEGLLSRLKAREYSEADLAALAYTLQVGREAMEERLGMTVVSLQELEEKLQGCLEGEEDKSDLYWGRVEQNKEKLAALATDEVVQENVSRWLENGEYGRLLEMWVRGLNLNWNRLYQGGKPKRLSLPGYPFARERYWLPEIKEGEEKGELVHSSLHPLLHRNTSDLKEQRYTSIFTGKEFFLRDHMVQGRHILPGVAYLEMARAAAELAAGDMQGENSCLKLKNVVWAQPAIVEEGEGLRLHLGLYPTAEGELAYEVYGASVIYSQGTIEIEGEKTRPKMDVAAAKAACSKGMLTGQQCYEIFSQMGIDYGPGHRAIEEVYLGEGVAVAKLVLPSAVKETSDGFVLHPTMMDGALQASLGLVLTAGASAPLVPFALEELEVYAGCVPRMWVLLRRSGSLDIDCCDEEGNVCVRLKGYFSRELKGEGTKTEETMLLEPCWREEDAASSVALSPAAGSENYGQHLVILCEAVKVKPKDVEGLWPGVRCLMLSSRKKDPAVRYGEYVLRVLQEIQGILRQKPKGRVLLQVVIPGHGESRLLAGLAGLLVTAGLENPQLCGQLIELEDWQGLERILRENREKPTAGRIRYREGTRYVAALAEVESFQKMPQSPWREGGRYLITGGAGGLGLLFAAEIARTTRNVTLILTGRSLLDTARENKIKELREAGAQVIYRQLDVIDQKAVENLVHAVVQEFGGLDGIIHSAGVIRDAFILNQSEAESLEVLSPKVNGLVNLDEATQDLKLDFFLLFSSQAAVLGNPGQAVYAAANAFLDSYVEYRNELVAVQERHGATLSVNWALWQEGGMGIEDAAEKIIRENTGMIPLRTSSAFLALYQGMEQGKARLMVMEGSRPLMERWLFGRQESGEYHGRENRRITEDLLVKAAALLQVGVEDLEEDTAWDEHGFDQVTLTKLVGELNREYGLQLSSAVFSSFPTLRSLAGYLSGQSAEEDGEQPGAAVSVPAHATADAAVLPAGELAEDAVEYLKKRLSAVIKLPPHRIEENAPLEKYGIDSVMVMQLTNELEKTFGSLPKTLFFEYQNLRELTGYFLEAHRVRLLDALGMGVERGEEDKPAAVVPWREETPRLVYERPRFATGWGRGRREDTSLSSDIAIIGLAGRYPGARNLREFWLNLSEGKDCITEIPAERWDHSRYFDEDRNKPGKTYSKWGGFLEGVDEFDPLFFNISPREAEIMEPQERLFLECVYETLEDAGYTRGSLASYRGRDLEGNIGVYVGVMYEEYQLYAAQQQLLGKPVTVSGNPSSVANRVSYFCNFHGPSMAIDTMCSSSITAIHLACRSLQNGECRLAIAGGVNVSIHPNKYLFLGQSNFVSSKGLCEAFGAGGDGYVPGEGVGAVLLKPLNEAVKDGDHIYGIVKGTALNHGGKTNGYSVPNPNAQAAVIGQALKGSGVNPRAVSYLEAHGTGTILGDPIEIAGLSKAFREHTKDTQFCAIGSVKSNIGHSESAAGIAGLTKVLLQMKHRQLVPSLHTDTLNPNIDFDTTPFVVQQKRAEWKPIVAEVGGGKKEYPLIAGVSSFGAGGSNAHLVVQEYIPEGERALPGFLSRKRPVLIVLSAKNEERLRERVLSLISIFQEEGLDEDDLVNVAYTLQVGREAMEERLALLVESVDEMVGKLQGFLSQKKDESGIYRGHIRQSKETIAVFAADEDMEKTLAAWIEKGKYGKLANLWVQGLDIDWRRLYTTGLPQRVSLPPYPFERERYWIPEKEALEEALDAGVSGTIRKTCFLQKQWELCPVVAGKSFTGKVAILATKETLSLAERLREYFSPGVVFEEEQLGLENGVFQEEAADWNGFIDLTGCGKEEQGSLTWLSRLQRLIENGKDRGLVVLGVTRGLEAFLQTEINLAGASRAGLYRMLQSEYGRLKSRHVELDPDSAIAESQLAEQIAAEFFAAGDEAEVCYRDGKRYQAVLREIPAERQEEKGEEKEGFVAGGFPAEQVLWITGGTRGLGYLCARHFVECYGVKRLVLTGREELPPRSEWEGYLEQDDGVGKKLRNILYLEEQGVQVLTPQVSLTDGEAFKKCVQEVTKALGPIGGVIHCAGSSDAKNPAFIRKPLQGLAEVLAPKVTGINVLYEALRGEPLRVFMVFSSVAGLIPTLGVGQSDYAMANAYLDYFVQAKEGEFPLLSIQWPSWKETGMGEVKTRAFQQTGLLSLTDEEGLRLMDTILAAKLGPVVMPAVVQTELWKPQRLMKARIEQEPVAVTGPSYSLTAREKKGEEGDAFSRVQAWLVGLFSRDLKIPPAKLDVDTPFQEYGVDSILLAQLLRSVNEVLPEEIDPSVFYEYSTIRLLTSWLVDNHAESFRDAAASAAREEVDSEVSRAQPQEAGQEARLELQERASGEVTVSAGIPASDSEIVVVGMSCRFPGAGNLDEYWQLLSQGKTAIRPAPPGWRDFSKEFWGGFIEDATYFDPEFFLLPEEDAAEMDPQALLVLEESLKAWHHAGYSLAELKGRRVGVYLGGRARYQPSEAGLDKTRNPIVVVGQNYLAANVSQFFDLRGPSLVVDTACSSALVGMHMALQALVSGEVEAALVGGVSLLHTDKTHLIFEQRRLLNPENRFHIFDRRAAGIVLGEGVGMVVVKTKQQALKDKDRIYARIKGLAVNNDGRTAGPATPNIQAQKEVMLAALEKSKKRPEEIAYLEANGSGSEVTDLLELKAITGVYRAASKEPLALGSIKPNIGHPLCAEGIAGFIKTVLMLHHGRMVPFLSGQEAMKHFALEETPLYFCRESKKWQGIPRVAALNCFADGGTNAHVILQAHDDSENKRPHREPLAPLTLKRRDVRSTGQGGRESIWKRKIVEG